MLRSLPVPAFSVIQTYEPMRYLTMTQIEADVNNHLDIS